MLREARGDLAYFLRSVMTCNRRDEDRFLSLAYYSARSVNFQELQ